MYQDFCISKKPYDSSVSLADLKLEQDALDGYLRDLQGICVTFLGPESGNRSRCMECFTWDIFDGMHGKLCEMII